MSTNSTASTSSWLLTIPIIVGSVSLHSSNCILSLGGGFARSTGPTIHTMMHMNRTRAQWPTSYCKYPPDHGETNLMGCRCWNGAVKIGLQLTQLLEHCHWPLITISEASNFFFQPQPSSPFLTTTSRQKLSTTATARIAAFLCTGSSSLLSNVLWRPYCWMEGIS